MSQNSNHNSKRLKLSQGAQEDEQSDRSDSDQEFEALINELRPLLSDDGMNFTINFRTVLSSSQLAQLETIADMLNEVNIFKLIDYIRGIIENENTKTALMITIAVDRPDLANLLLDSDVDNILDYGDDNGNTALIYAFIGYDTYGDDDDDKDIYIDIIDKILKLCPECINIKNQDKVSPLEWLILNRNFELASKLLSYDNIVVGPITYDDETGEGWGITPLLIIVEHGEFDVFKKYIRKYPQSINDKDDAGENILMHAIEGFEDDKGISTEDDELAMTKNILSMYPNLIHSKDNNNKNILMHVASKGNVKMLREIFTKDELLKQLNEVDNDGKTALRYAAVIDENLDMVKELLKIDVNLLNKADNDGYTPLIFAAHQSQVNLVTELLKYDNICIDCKDNEGNTALNHFFSVYSRIRYENSEEKLKKIGITLLKYPQPHGTLGKALINVIKNNYGAGYDVVKLLLSYDVTIAGYIDDKGYTPLMTLLKSFLSNKNVLMDYASVYTDPMPIFLLLFETGHSRPWHTAPDDIEEKELERRSKIKRIDDEERDRRALYTPPNVDAAELARRDYMLASKYNKTEAPKFKYIEDVLLEYRQYNNIKNSYAENTEWYNVCKDINIYDKELLIEKSKALKLPIYNVYDGNRVIKTKSQLCEQLSRLYYDFIQYVNFMGIENDKNKFYKVPDRYSERKPQPSSKEGKCKASGMFIWDEKEFLLMDTDYYVSDEYGNCYTLDEIYTIGVKDKKIANMYMDPLRSGQKWSKKFIDEYESKIKRRNITYFIKNNIPYAELDRIAQKSSQRKNIQPFDEVKAAIENLALITATDYMKLKDVNIDDVIRYIREYNIDTYLEAIKSVRIAQLGNRTFLDYILNKGGNKFLNINNTYEMLKDSNYDNMSSIDVALQKVFREYTLLT